MVAFTALFIISTILGLAPTIVESALGAVSDKNRQKIYSMISKAKSEYGIKSKEMQATVQKAANILGLTGYDPNTRVAMIRDAAKTEKEAAKQNKSLQQLENKINAASDISGKQYVLGGAVADVESHIGGNL